MADQITERTKIPISWLLTGLVLINAVALYLADMRTSISIQEQSSLYLQKRLETLETEYREELRSIRDEIKQLNENLRKK